MQAPETRIINRCTYAPIIPKQDDKRPNQAVLKQGLLGCVFNRRVIGELALHYLRDEQEKASKDEKAYPHLENLCKAVIKMWEGDFAASLKILREIDSEEVIDFGKGALKAEKDLLEKAREDVKNSVVKIAQEEKCSEETVRELHREIASLRESIISDVRNLISSEQSFATSKGIKVGSQELDPLLSSGDHTVLQENISALNTKAIPTSTISISKTIITQDKVYADISKNSPISAEYLKAIGFFTLPPTIEKGKLNYELISTEQEEVKKKCDILRALIEKIKIEPLGWLHLERLQFTPLGYERGDLVYSLPMLPGETVRLSHREWSRTETEYSKLVSESLENATEEALSEKSELAQSSDAERQHSSGHNVSVDASATYSGFTISSSYGYSCQDSERQTRQLAAKKSKEITRKASSRVKEEHKVTFKVTTAYELEEQSYREIKNPLDRAVRWDFHRLMKKWKIDLYRYDARLTYDLVIPEPGSYLLRKYIYLKALEDALALPFYLGFSATDISDSIVSPFYWDSLSKRYDVALEPPPLEEIYVSSQSAELKYNGEKNNLRLDSFIEIQLPEGYNFFAPSSEIDFEKSVSMYGQYITNWVHNSGSWETWFEVQPAISMNWSTLYKGAKNSENFKWWFMYWWYGSKYNIPPGISQNFGVTVKAILTERAKKEWQTKCYEKLVDAAKAQYDQQHQLMKQKRDELAAELNREDALMLRKQEHEEIMKRVLCWILGPTFSFYPKDIGLPTLTMPSSAAIFHDQGELEYYDQKTQSVKKIYHDPYLLHGEIIRFLHQAIEWENIVYVLYPYFWTDELRWNFKQFLYHNDYSHRCFLRAGAARVVLTLRRGFEKRFLSFMEGHIDAVLQDTDQYMSAADELEAMAKTKYPYTPDANIEKEEFLFNWEDVGQGIHDERLRRILKNDFYIPWAENANIDKYDDLTLNISKDITICLECHTISDGLLVKCPNPKCNSLNLKQSGKEENFIKITLDRNRNEATLKITDDATYLLKVKEEDNKYKIYKEQNWVDTWYEFTPTGALDVSEGKVLGDIGAGEGIGTRILKRESLGHTEGTLFIGAIPGGSIVDEVTLLPSVTFVDCSLDLGIVGNSSELVENDRFEKDFGSSTPIKIKKYYASNTAIILTIGAGGKAGEGTLLVKYTHYG
jgi:hypothetical protein